MAKEETNHAPYQLVTFGSQIALILITTAKQLLVRWLGPLQLATVSLLVLVALNFARIGPSGVAASP